MAKAINTLVYGSPNTCEAAADWLDQFCRAVDDAEEELHDADSDIRSGPAWYGPAFDAYSDSQHGIGRGLEDLSSTASDWSGALRDFGAGIRGVQQKMEGIVDQAKQGGLEVHGPFILAPELNVKPPKKPKSEKADPAAGTLKGYEIQAWGYNQLVDEHNKKVELFNDLQDQAFDQRKTEKELHQVLNEAFVLSNDLNVINYSLTGVSWGQTFIASVDDTYKTELKKLNELKKSEGALNDFSHGIVPSEADSKRVEEVMAKQDSQAARVRAAAG